MFCLLNKWKNNFGHSSVWYLETNSYMQQSNEKPKRTYVCNMRGITLNIRNFSSDGDRIRNGFNFSIMPTDKEEINIPFTVTSRQTLIQPSSIGIWISCPECRLLCVWCSQSEHTVRILEIQVDLFSLPLHSHMALCLGLLALYHWQKLMCMFA
jgi:hypothetical protein